MSCKKLAGWYSQLATGLDAGIPVVEAIERFRGPKPAWRKKMVRALRAGQPLEQVFSETSWIPPADRPALTAGARSGRLPETLRVLSRKQEMLARQARRVKGETIYPLLVFHFAAGALPVRELIFGNAVVYLGQVLSLLVPLWLAIAALVFLMRRPRVRGHILRFLPLWRRFWKNQSLADFCFTLEAGTAAGAGAASAWRDAGRASANPALEKAAGRIAETIEREGRHPGELLDGFRVFPEDFAHFYQAGEISGRTPENLSYLADQFRENAAGALHTAAVVYSILPFLALAIFVGYTVISFYGGYFEQIDQMIP